MENTDIFDITQAIDRIVLDGGPCGGKTTLTAKLVALLMERNIIAVIVPEAATQLKSAGIHPQDFTDIDYQIAIVRMQEHNERFFEDMAYELQKKFKKRVVMICDRGLLSGSAYLQSSNQLTDFEEKVLSKFNMTSEDCRARYRGIIHLTSAAHGAEEFFSAETNKVRDDGIELAKILDDRSLACWVGMEEIRNLRNVTPEGVKIPFNKKMDDAAAYALRMLGVPFVLQSERKFLLDGFNPELIQSPFGKISITQTYLSNNDNFEERVRKRVWMQGTTYWKTRKMEHQNGERIKVESTISGFDYFDATNHRKDPTRIPIKKDRYCFFWNYNYYKVDVFHEPNIAPILKFYGEGDLPAFLNVVREVTHDMSYRNAELSKIK